MIQIFIQTLKLGVLHENPPHKKKHCFVVKAFRRIKSFTGKLYAPITRRIPNPFSFHTTNGILHTTNFKSETDINWINNSEFDLVNFH